MQRKGPLPGKIFALCIPERRFAALFGYMARESCQCQLVLDTRRQYVAREGRFSRPGPLRGCMKRENCHGKAPGDASRRNIAAASRSRTHFAKILPWTNARIHLAANNDRSPAKQRQRQDPGNAPKTKEGERFARLLSLFSFTTRVARGLRSNKPPTFGIPLGWGFRVRRNCASRPIC